MRDDDDNDPVSALPNEPLPIPPPMPPGLTPETQYLGSVIQWSASSQIAETRAMRSEARRTARKTHAAIADLNKDVEALPKEAPVGPLSRAMVWFGGLPVAAQIALGFAAAQLALNLSGAAYAKVVGSPPPQVTVPTMVTNPIQLAAPAEDDDPAILHGTPE